MDSSNLHKLTRTQLQSLAKRELVRAVGKTEDIIRRLMRKHPGGVPLPEDVDNPSASSAPPKRNFLKKHHKDTPSPSVVPETSDHEGERAAKTVSSSPSSSVETVKQLLLPEDEPAAGPSNTNPKIISASHSDVTESEAQHDHPVTRPVPFHGDIAPVPPSEHSSQEAHDKDKGRRSAAPPPGDPKPDWQADDNQQDGVYDYPNLGPNRHTVVDTLRQFTTLANNIPSMETCIADSRRLLQRTEALLQKATPDVREAVVAREYLESCLLARMKRKRELWDGTGKMPKAARKFRMEWLRAERRAEDEKLWREINEVNRQCGLEPEPLSTFVSESDEEVVGSLQTTPASSRGGSRKRPREESVGAESDGDGSGDGNQRKKARV